MAVTPVLVGAARVGTRLPFRDVQPIIGAGDARFPLVGAVDDGGAKRAGLEHDAEMRQIGEFGRRDRRRMETAPADGRHKTFSHEAVERFAQRTTGERELTLERVDLQLGARLNAAIQDSSAKERVGGVDQRDGRALPALLRAGRCILCIKLTHERFHAWLRPNCQSRSGASPGR